MARQRHRTPLDYEAEDKQDIRRQEFIFLSTFFLMVLLMVSLYFQLSLLAIGAVVVALLASTVGFCIHYRTFFSMRFWFTYLFFHAAKPRWSGCASGTTSRTSRRRTVWRSWLLRLVSAFIIVPFFPCATGDSGRRAFSFPFMAV